MAFSFIFILMFKVQIIPIRNACRPSNTICSRLKRPTMAPALLTYHPCISLASPRIPAPAAIHPGPPPPCQSAAPSSLSRTSRRRIPERREILTLELPKYLCFPHLCERLRRPFLFLALWPLLLLFPLRSGVPAWYSRKN